MDEDELLHGLVNSLAFEVEAIPEDNVIKFTATNGTPLNVKVRVRNKDEPRLVQRGIVSVPKLGKHIASLDQIKLISSDQTILSFNIYMETELKKQSPPKTRKHGFNIFKLGGCLGTSYDEDESPYLPGPSNKKALRSRTSSKSDSDIHAENMDITENNELNLETSNAATRNQKKLFGKCKPGGCLDPPFGEDKEPFRPANSQSHVKPKHAVYIKDTKEDQSISTSSVSPGKSSKEASKLLKKETNKDVIETKPLLDIYARPVSLEHSSTSNYSNAAVRHPSKMSSSKILDAGKKTSRTYDDDSLRQNYQYPETYFIPPKDMLHHKEEERRYSRERSNDQIRPATTHRENEHQTSDTPHIFDVPSKKYPENADARSPTKLSKNKGKDNTERIKQTLTDLTSNEVDNARKSSDDYGKNRKMPLNVSLDTQKVGIISGNQEAPSHVTHDVTDPQNINDFEIFISPDNSDLTVIYTDLEGAKSEELNQNMPPAKNKESIENKFKPLSEKLDEPENKNLSKDMRNKNILKNEEPIQSAFILEAINTTNPESGKIADFYFSPTLVSSQEEVKILQPVPSADTQKCPEIDYSPTDFRSNKPKYQTKLSIAGRLPSTENVHSVDDTNEKNNTTPVARLNDSPKTENRDQNIYPDTTKYADTIQNSPSRKISKEQTNVTQNLENHKQMNENSYQPVDEANDEQREKLLRTNEIRGKKTVQEQQTKDFPTNKLGSDEIQKAFNNFKAIEDTAKKTLEDLDLKIINNEKLHDLGVETPKAKLNDLNSKSTLNNDWKANKMNTIASPNILQNSTPETFHENILNEIYRKSKENYDTDIVLNGTIESREADTFVHDTDNNNKNTKNIPDFKGITLDNNNENSRSAETIRPENITKVASDDALMFDKQLQNNYPESNESKIQATNIENALTLDDIRQQTTASTIDNSYSKHQPIDTSVPNANESYLLQNLSYNSILKADKEFAASSTNSIDFSSNLKTQNLNNEDDEKDPGKVNLTDNDKVIIKNTSLQDRNKNLSINTQERIPSIILQKTPLLRTDNSDLRNDDINVIKPFKRNTFTIVPSSTSLEKQDELISIQQIDHVTGEHFNDKKDKRFVPSDQTTTDSESFVQNDEQGNNAIVVDLKQEPIFTDSFVNIRTSSETSLKVHDRPVIESAKEIGTRKLENQLVGNQNNGNTKIKEDTKYDDKVRTEDFHKFSVSSDINLNDVKKVDSGISQSQEENNDKIYKKEEKLILKDMPVDLAKQISEPQDRSDDFENIDLGLNMEIASHYSENFVIDALNDKFNDVTEDNKTIQISNLPSLDNTDDLQEFFTTNLSKEKTIDANNFTHVETKLSLSDDKSDSESARAALEYGSRLLEISEGKFNNQLGLDLNNTLGNILQSSVASEPDEHTFELFSVEKLSNAKHQNRPVVDEDGNIREKSDLGLERSLNEVINKQLLMSEDGTRYKDKVEEIVTNTIIDEDGNFRKISDSGAVGNFSKIIDNHSLVSKDDTGYDDGIRINEYGGAVKISEFDSVESINKNSEKNLMHSEDGTRYDTENDSSSKFDENGDLSKISALDSGEIFNEVIDNTPLLTTYDITRDIEHDNANKSFEDGALRKLSGLKTMGRFREDNGEKQPMQEKYARYYGEYAPSSKAQISTNKLGYIDQPATKIHLNTITSKQPNEKSDSVILKQQDGTRIKTYNQNENKPNRTDAEEMYSNPIQKTKSEVLFINLALQSYVNDNNEMIVQTLSPLVEPVRYTDDNITVVQSLIRHGREIRIPVDVENDLSLKFVSKTQKVPQEGNSDQNTSKKIRITKNLSEHAHHRLEDVDESLAFIYERKLIPLHEIIRNLTEEINTLTTQQEMLKVKLRGAKKTKSLRLIPVSKRCGCGGV